MHLCTSHRSISHWVFFHCLQDRRGKPTRESPFYPSWWQLLLRSEILLSQEWTACMNARFTATPGCRAAAARLNETSLESHRNVISCLMSYWSVQIAIFSAVNV
jgi:hypothetical protein